MQTILTDGNRHNHDRIHSNRRTPPGSSHSTSRRAFLADVGMGFTGLVLGKMLADEGVVRAGDAKALAAARRQAALSPPRPKASSGSFWSAA